MANNNIYKTQRQWSDKFIPQIKQIVGSKILSESTVEQDTQENTDLITLFAKPLSISCRIRRYSYYSRYPNDITIRCKVISNQPTELDKLKAGYGDWMFYGHSNQTETAIEHWRIIDLNVLRNCINNPYNINWNIYDNGDGSKLISYDLLAFKNNKLILFEQ